MRLTAAGKVVLTLLVLVIIGGVYWQLSPQGKGGLSLPKLGGGGGGGEATSVQRSGAENEVVCALDTWAGYLPLYLARQRGLDQKGGLSLTLVQDGANYDQRFQRLDQGEYDFAVATVDSWVLGHEVAKAPGIRDFQQASQAPPDFWTLFQGGGEARQTDRREDPSTPLLPAAGMPPGEARQAYRRVYSPSWQRITEER